MKIYIVKRVIGAETEISFADTNRVSAFLFLNEMINVKKRTEEGSWYVEVWKDCRVVADNRIDTNIKDVELMHSEINRALNSEFVDRF